MQINGSLLSYAKPSLGENGGSRLPATVTESIKDVYQRNQTPIHLAGGALLGAGLASAAGIQGSAVISSACSGAFAGWIASSPRQAACMAGGALVGATVAGLAGLNGHAMMSAVSAGTFIGWMAG